MRESIVLVAVGWVLLALLGAGLLAAVPSAARRMLLPAAPLVGAGALVVVLHTTGILLPVRWGLLVVAVALVAALVVGLRRDGLRGLVDRRSLGWLAAGLAVGIPATLVALAPSRVVGDSRLVSPNQSNDGVWYVSVSSWLQNHSILQVPDIGAAPAPGGAVPADGPAVSALTFPLRVGQELVLAALNTVTGTSPITTFSPWIALWVLLIPGGCVAAAAVMGLPRATGLVAGVVVSTSALVLQQLYNQNAASLLGIAMVALVLAGVMSAVEGRGIPVVVGAAMLSALVGTYSEYVPFVAPALLAGVLLRRHGHRAAVVRAVLVVAVAVALAPLAWWRAYLTLTGVRGGVTESLPGALLDAPVSVILNRLVGVGPLGAATVPSTLGPILVGIVLLGVLLALVLGPSRGLWFGYVASGSSFIAYLSVSGVGYTQRRALEIAVPVVLFAAVAGWGVLVGRLASGILRRPARAAEDRGSADGAAGPDASADARPAAGRRGSGTASTGRRVAVAGLVLVAVVPVAVWAGVNVRSSMASYLQPVDLQARHVDSDFSDAVGWVEEVGGASGADVSVAVPSFFEQQWLALSLEDEPAVEYPSIRSDYFRTESFWAGDVDRYWLIGNGVQLDADPAAVVYSNDRFRLIDMDAGDVLMAVPFGLNSWNTGVRPDGGFTTLGDASVLLVRSAAGVGDEVQLTLRAESAAPLEVSVAAPGNPVYELDDLTPEPREATVLLPPDEQTAVVDLVPSVEDDSQALNWIEMMGVRRVE